MAKSKLLKQIQQEDNEFYILEAVRELVDRLERKYKCSIMYNIDDIKFKNK